MIAYLGIGTNIGDRLQNLIDTVEALNLLPLTKVVEISNVYETAPVGYANQDDFLNIVVAVSTDLNAHNLLGAALGIEAGMGRIRTIKNGPRIIDVDLLMYENEKIDSLTLWLPPSERHTSTVRASPQSCGLPIMTLSFPPWRMRQRASSTILKARSCISTS